jgi:hypothetical protein
MMATARAGDGFVFVSGGVLLPDWPSYGKCWQSRLAKFGGRWEDEQVAVHRLLAWLLDKAQTRDRMMEGDLVLPKTLDLPKLRGKTRAELADIFPGTEDALDGWNGFKRIHLRFTPKHGKLAAVFLIPETPLSERNANWILTRNMGIALPADKSRVSTSSILYRNLDGPIRTVNLIDVDWNSKNMEIGWIGVFYDIPWYEN